VSGFSLWTEPWVPVQTLEGAPRKVSLPQALTEAHTLRGILDPSPLVTVALHRMLLALIYRTHALASVDQWQTLWKAGRFDAHALEVYGQKWAERFDLLHPTRPFYQVLFQPDEKVHPVAALLLEAASGNNPALFDHGCVEGAAVLPLDRAACYLLAHQLFAPAGGKSKPFYRSDAPLTVGLVVEVMGRTLFETLVLNAMPLSQWRELAPPSNEDRPFWEELLPTEPVEDGTRVRGPLHYLTWQSRQVKFVADPDRRAVTHCQIAQRYCLPKDGSRVDPGKSYLTNKAKSLGWFPQCLQKDRAVWRHTHVLLQPTNKTHAQPQVISWLAALRNREKLSRGLSLPKSVALAVSGLITDAMQHTKIFQWRREEIGLPLAILDEPQLVEQVNQLMTVAVEVERHLTRTGEALIWALAERNHLDNALDHIWKRKNATAKMPPTVPGAARSLGIILRYWAAMEGPFRQALWQLPETSAGAVQQSWRETLQCSARSALKVARDALQGSGAPWEPLSRIEDAFDRRLQRVLDSIEEGKDDDDNDDA